MSERKTKFYAQQTFTPVASECARASTRADNGKHRRRSKRWENFSKAAVGLEGELAMKPRNTKHESNSDPEALSQERSDPILWIVFHATALLSAMIYWLRYKRVCAWHEPKPRRMAGSPFAGRVTHGICPDCFARISGQLISHGETASRVSVAKGKHPNWSSLPAPPARNCAAPAWLQRPSAGDTDTA